ncbi:MAG: LptF/LptG family permease [Paludibacter sp.]|nr:LptF/LptG family permease [Paludibacter sp.]
MFHFKKIDSYIFKRFFTLFLMTFLICIFILLMQFLWKHVAELVGKGIGWSVLGEFFVYAILSLVPMALPLAILLASLMTFGNLGENFELTAMKAAGVSLFRIMRPLIIFISLVCVGAFYFSNYVLPISQTKLWTLIFSLRQKSPEFDIPVGEFYSGIEGYNIYVRGKSNHLLKDMMIYDFSGGFENATVIVSDSGRVQFTEDNKYLLLSLYDGESFENLKKQRISSSANSIPYSRQTFRTKEILLDFNTDFNRFDESMLQDQHVSKNFKQLTHSIDSVSKIANSTSSSQAKDIVSQHFLGREILRGTVINDSLKKDKKLYNPDSLFLSLNQQSMVRATNTAVERAKTMKDLIDYNKMMLNAPVSYVLRHEIERHRKFTLSFACLIFFFIGAPLGAIIRKGGLGTPVVISVIMFIIYYIIDNTGYKMARESIWPSYQGMWLSSALLLPIGIFITYKAVVDATLLNPEQYIKTWNLIRLKINSILNKQ